MSMMESSNSLGIEFSAKEAKERDEQGRRVLSIKLEVLDSVPREKWDMDSLNWCGGQALHVGGLEQVKALHESLGKSIQWWEELQATGKVAFK